MRIRIKFEKLGRIKFIGHLDLLRIFNRALNRASVPVAYSQGFNPHMLITFACPLPLGVESVCEYADIQLTAPLLPESFQSELNKCLPHGLRILETYPLVEPFSRIMALVTKASYDIQTDFSITREMVSDFISRETIDVVKKSKKKERFVDIKPLINQILPTTHGLRVLIAAGSEKNLKAELLMQAFTQAYALPFHPGANSIVRKAIYTGEGNNCIPLSHVGTIRSNENENANNY